MQNTTSFASANLQAATRACQAPATVINFDDLPATGTSGALLPASYENTAGLQLTGFGYINGASFPNSGYVNGVTSVPNDGFSLFGTVATITSTAGVFDLVSIQLTAAFTTGNTVLITGFIGATVVATTTFTLSEANPILATFPASFQALTSVTFTSGNLEQVVLDDITLNQNCVPVTTGGGDPWFTSFDGMRFPFDGVPGKAFNLVSEQSHQLNVLFVAEANPRHSALHGVSTGTWMQKVRPRFPWPLCTM